MSAVVCTEWMEKGERVGVQQEEMVRVCTNDPDINTSRCESDTTTTYHMPDMYMFSCLDFCRSENDTFPAPEPQQK